MPGNGIRSKYFSRSQARAQRSSLEKREEDRLDILGPLGKGFDWSAVVKGKIVFLVGGGRGIAPLYFLARELRTAGARVKVFYGGKSLPDLPLRHKFEQAGLDIACSTDDGTSGFHGFVTGLLRAEISKQRPAALFVCGPDPMMKKTAEIASREKIPAQFSRIDDGLRLRRLLGLRQAHP